MKKPIETPEPIHMLSPSASDTVDYVSEMLRELALMTSKSISENIASEILDIAQKVERHGSK